MDQKADQILIESILQGNQQAFNELVEKHQRMVINTCNGFLHNIQDAEDIAQDVFLEVYTSLGSFRNEARFSTWLYRISVNKSLNLLRRRKRRQWIQSMEEVFRIKDRIMQPESDQNPLKDLEREENSKLLHDALKSLPENQRIAFVLHKYEELPSAEVADIMETSLSSVESLIHRAKLNLQKKLIQHIHKGNDPTSKK